MLATAIIVFREILEAALIIGIVAAATRGVAQRSAWIIGGVCAGAVGAVGVAAIAGVIVSFADGMGQEIFNASILLLAVCMLAWHNIWMASHSRELVSQMKKVGAAVKEGGEPMYAIALVVCLAVLREGSEIVLFMHGVVAQGATSLQQMIMGATGGVFMGAGIGLALYAGLIRIPLQYLFRVTGWVILLLAAGMSSQAAAFLIQADILPALGEGIWNASSVISNDSVMGKLLHTLVGYDASPSGMQLVCYVLTVVVIGVAMKVVNKTEKSSAMRSNTVAALVLLAVVGITHAPDALAGPASYVYMPHVEYGETELEFHGGAYFDDDQAFDEEQGAKVAVGHGMTTWWFSEIEAEWEKEPGDGTAYKGWEWVNIFQLTEAGEYWVDLGWFTELKFPDNHDSANKIEMGPMFQKDIGNAQANLNLIWVRDYGTQAEHNTEFEYAWQLKWRGNQALEFGAQGFGEIGDTEDTLARNEQEHKLGPALFGEYHLANSGKFKYNTALLLGATESTPDVSWRFTVEYEFR